MPGRFSTTSWRCPSGFSVLGPVWCWASHSSTSPAWSASQCSPTDAAVPSRSPRRWPSPAFCAGRWAAPCSSSHRTTPVAASKPYALPPVSKIAWVSRTILIGSNRSVSRVPGAEPRTRLADSLRYPADPPAREGVEMEHAVRLAEPDRTEDDGFRLVAPSGHVAQSKSRVGESIFRFTRFK